MRKRIVFLAWFALLFVVYSCGNEAEKERVKVEKEIEAAKEDSIHRYNEILSSVKNDSAWKKLEKTLSGYDSVGIDSLGRTIFVKRRGNPSPTNLMTDPVFQNKIKQILDTVSVGVKAVSKDSCKKDPVCRKKNYESLEKLLANCKNDPYYPCSDEVYERVKNDLREWEYDTHMFKDAKKRYKVMEKTGKSFNEVISEEIAVESKRRVDSSDAICKKDVACRKRKYEAIKQGLEICKRDSICFKGAYEKRKLRLKEWE